MNLRDLIYDQVRYNREQLLNLAENCWENICSRRRTTHDNLEVVFHKDRFEHAFYTSSNRARRPHDKDIVDLKRIVRIRWILAVVSGNVRDSECWECPSKETGRRKPPDRLYIVWSEGYVVWLHPKADGGWRFSTAYCAPIAEIKKYCRGGTKIWKKSAP